MLANGVGLRAEGVDGVVALAPSLPPVHVDPTAFDGALDRLRQLPVATRDLPAALVEVAAALPAVFDVDGAGLLLLDEEQALRCVCATDPLTDALEATQEATGRGPCVDAFVDGTVVTVDDTGVDERWQGLCRRLAAAGIGAILGMPVTIGGAAVGSLNVYTKRPHAWDESDVTSIAAFAELVDGLLAAAVAGEAQGRLAEQLQHALDVRLVVERAVGVVMGLRQISATEAFAALRAEARRTRRPLRELAEEIAEELRLPF